MTRLTTDDIKTTVSRLVDYDAELFVKTGASLAGLASRAAGFRYDRFGGMLEDVSVAVTPFTSGRGVIPGFCDAVRGVVLHLGLKAFITRQKDAAGIAEAFEKQADIIFFSDDDRFVALHTPSRKVIDNAASTARGYVVGLSLMAGGLKRKKVLVLGCGSVGEKAAIALAEMEARISVYDIEPGRTEKLSRMVEQSLNTEITVLSDLGQALSDHRHIVDATPVKDLIQAHHIRENMFISAPGMPCGLTENARSKVSDRLLHDPLQIGVATMLFDALKYHLQPDQSKGGNRGGS